jgi:hypothetical protein
VNDVGDLKKEIENIKNRNKRVETDKAWEVSWVRKISVALFTYILISILLISIGNDKPFLNALIPALAYLISTASLDIVKKLWVKNRENNNNARGKG